MIAQIGRTVNGGIVSKIRRWSFSGGKRPEADEAVLGRLYKYFSYSEMPIVSSSYWNMLHTGGDPTGENIMKTLGRSMAELLRALPEAR